MNPRASQAPIAAMDTATARERLRAKANPQLASTAATASGASKTGTSAADSRYTTASNAAHTGTWRDSAFTRLATRAFYRGGGNRPPALRPSPSGPRSPVRGPRLQLR